MQSTRAVWTNHYSFWVIDLEQPYDCSFKWFRDGIQTTSSFTTTLNEFLWGLITTLFTSTIPFRYKIRLFFIDLLHHIFWRLHERLISRNLLRYLTISRGYETYIMCIVDCTLWGGKLQCRIGFLAHETRGQTTKTYGSSRYLLLIKKHLRTKYWAQHWESDRNSHCDETMHDAETSFWAKKTNSKRAKWGTA